MNEILKLLARIEDENLRQELIKLLERRGQLRRQLYLPEIGDQLRLVKPWTFLLYNEGRNKGLWDALGIKLSKGRRENGSWIEPKPVEVSLPEGTLLTVDRIYIRQGMKEYSSVTFRSILKGIKKKPRFWAKLGDVNNIQFDPVDQTIPQPV